LSWLLSKSRLSKYKLTGKAQQLLAERGVGLSGG